MKSIAVFVALLGLAAAEITWGDGGSYSYRLDNAASTPEPMAEPEPEIIPAKLPCKHKIIHVEPAALPEFKTEILPKQGYYYRLISGEHPAELPMPEPMEPSKASGYSYRLISGEVPQYAAEFAPVEPASMPGYSYRLISENDAEKPASGFPSFVLPNSLYNWFSGLKPDFSQYLPQLAQYRYPEYAYRYPEFKSFTPAKVEEKEMPASYSYKQL